MSTYNKAVAHIIALGFAREHAESIAEMDLESESDREHHLESILTMDAGQVFSWIHIPLHESARELDRRVSQLEQDLDEMRRERDDARREICRRPNDRPEVAPSECYCGDCMREWRAYAAKRGWEALWDRTRSSRRHPTAPGGAA